MTLKVVPLSGGGGTWGWRQKTRLFVTERIRPHYKYNIYIYVLPWRSQPSQFEYHKVYAGMAPARGAAFGPGACLVQEIRDFNTSLTTKGDSQQSWEPQSWSRCSKRVIIVNCEIKTFHPYWIEYVWSCGVFFTFLGFEFKNSQTAHSQTLGSWLTLNSARQ